MFYALILCVVCFSPGNVGSLSSLLLPHPRAQHRVGGTARSCGRVKEGVPHLRPGTHRGSFPRSFDEAWKVSRCGF